jgi:WD repeat-containing protein 68
MFDLRALEHSTILYESASSSSKANNNNNNNGIGGAGPNSPSSSSSSTTTTPLLRLAFNPTDANTLAIIHQDVNEVLVLDIRSPGVPVAELRAHKAAVNSVAWSGDGHLLGSCGS